MMDAGHTHGPTAYLVNGCPLCDAAKAARNQAIEHLSEALYLLAGLRSEDDPATLRLNLGPINITGDDIGSCHSIDLSAKQAEALSDAIDSMNAYAGSDRLQDIEVDRGSLARRKAELMAWMEGQTGEVIDSGKFSAAAVAQGDTDLWDSVNDIYAELDLLAFTKKVLDDATADNLTVNQALDSFFGAIPAPDALGNLIDPADEDDV